MRPDEVDRLAHAEPGREPDLLQDSADPPTRGRLARVEPEELRASRVEPAEAEQDRHGRRLAGAVRAEQREDLAAAELEVDAVERRDVAEGAASTLETGDDG